MSNPVQVLVVDNHDSFTFNLIELLRQLGVPFQHCFVENLPSEQTLVQFSHFLISPGPDVPSAYPQLNRFWRWAEQQKQISVLGICLGHQSLCEFFGGTLQQLAKPRHGEQHLLYQQTENPLFKGLPDKFTVGLYHSWQVARQTLPAVLQIIASNGVGDILAVAHKHLPFYGVQFHPESIMSAFGLEIFTNWLNVGRNFRQNFVKNSAPVKLV